MRPTLKALEDALPAKKSTAWGPVGEDPEDRGYILMDYEEARPVTENSQFTGYRESIGSLGNDGTSSPSFEQQPQEVDAMYGVDKGRVDTTKAESHKDIGGGDEAAKVSMRGREKQKKEASEDE